MIGNDIHNLARRLWGINRSITGSGTRETLSCISEILPTLQVHEVKSGEEVFDWVVPKEWHVDDAYIIDPDGNKICDFKKNNLYLVGYSTPVDKVMTLDELQNHLYSLPDQLNAIPYITSYYKERWGFCISQEDRNALSQGHYRVVVKSKLFDGVLNYGEIFIKGASDKEVFISTYICHPSMANNELSGLTVVIYLVKWLLQQKSLTYSYRIVFIPETIGSIVYLSKNIDHLKKHVFAGFNVTCVGDDRAYSYVPSRQGNTISDKVAKHVLRHIDDQFVSYTWSDRGSDERQYCAPGVDLPIASICRTKYGQYPEYHTSLDDLDNVVTPLGLNGGYEAIRRALEALENNNYPKIKVLGEPQLGKRGLYPTLSTKSSGNEVRVMMNFISWCDGQHSLLEIAEKIDAPIWDLYDLVSKLSKHGLVQCIKY